MQILDKNTVVISTGDELKTVLEDENTYTYVYFNNDISISSSILINEKKKYITIDGTYQNVRHTYNSISNDDSSNFITASKGNKIITMKSMDIVNTNTYGIIYVPASTDYSGVTTKYVGISLKGTKMLYNPYGVTVIMDSIITIEPTNGINSELVADASNLKIEPHKKIAIVGKSGNGKSTIFNLLLRYFDVTKGTITIDGTDIKSLTEESLRQNISIIRQTPFLFNMSIIDNLKLVKEDASLEEIKDVCKKAYIDEYIESLPNGYDTIIGEGGINLSGGQRQRLAIARTLLMNTKIILFDEATSALDNKSQEYIKRTIDSLVKDHTIIIVAHRLSTIKDADIINVIDEGQLVASGTHDYLLKNSNVYNELY